MTRKQQIRRRRLAELRACIMDGKPWSIVPSVYSEMVNAINSGDANSVKSMMTFGREVKTIGNIVNGVMIIPVTGVLRDQVDFMVRYGMASSYQLIERELKQAVANKQLKAVLLYFDTPGGSAIGCKRVAELINQLKVEKPIYGSEKAPLTWATR